MSFKESELSVNEQFSGSELILHLIETARTFVDSDIQQAKDFFEKGLTLSNNVQFDEGAGDCYFELGKISLKLEDSTQAFKYLQDAISTFKKIDNKLKHYQCCTFLVDVCIEIGNYGQALEQQIDAVNDAAALNDHSLLGEAYNKTGNINKVLKHYSKAIEYHTKALISFEKINDKTGKSISNYYLGNCYNWKGEMDTAITFLELSLSDANDLNDPFLKVKPLGSLATVYTKLKEYDYAIDLFYKAIDLVNITNERLLKADLLRNLGNLLIETSDFDKAIASLTESLAIAEQEKRNYPKNLIHQSLANAYEKTGNFEQSLVHYKFYHNISNELINEDVALKTKGIHLKYDFEETKRQKDLAEKTVSLKDQFIANISHEIRTPLNGVLGMADLLADTNPTPEQLEYINTIKLSANNLIYIINDILDYSKIQSGDVTLANSKFNIRNLISDIAQVIKVKCDEKKLALFVSIDNDVPENLNGDEVRLKQILLNLLSNSIKFTNEGRIKADVKITNVNGMTISLLFTISDTGQGIADSQISSIFDTFSQVESDYSKSATGAGLGLAIVKQLVGLLKGEISVNSTLGKGSEFKITLPFNLLEPISFKKGPAKTKTTLELTDLSGLKVLIVEDNKVNQFLAQKLLERMGISVQIASGGEEAIKLLNKSSYQLILMDVQMPEMNGYELTEYIRRELPEPQRSVPVIALTAYASLQERTKALELGMSDYITKPYSPHELMAAITKQVNLKKIAQNIANNPDYEVNEQQIKSTTDQLLKLFNNNVNDVLSLIHMLIHQIPMLIYEIENALQEKNWPLAFQEIHKLRSSVNLLKLSGISNLAAELEEYSRDEIQTYKIPKLFEQFKLMCNKAVTLLKEEVIRLKKLDYPK